MAGGLTIRCVMKPERISLLIIGAAYAAFIGEVLWAMSRMSYFSL